MEMADLPGMRSFLNHISLPVSTCIDKHRTEIKGNLTLAVRLRVPQPLIEILRFELKLSSRALRTPRRGRLYGTSYHKVHRVTVIAKGYPPFLRMAFSCKATPISCCTLVA